MREKLPLKNLSETRQRGLHPGWVKLIRHCQQMGHGEIERLKIQDGIPVMAEKSIQKLKLT